MNQESINHIVETVAEKTKESLERHFKEPSKNVLTEMHIAVQATDDGNAIMVVVDTYGLKPEKPKVPHP